MNESGTRPCFRPIRWLMSSLLALLVAGCGSDSSDSLGGFGTLRVSLTDAPACGFDAVNVTVAKVRVHRSSTANDMAAGWAEITLNPARKINLLALNNGVLDTLGETSLPAGRYTQLRLVLEPNPASGGGLANSVVPTGGVEVLLETPSAIQSGIKLVHQFDIMIGQRADLVLDFDACKSVVRTGAGTHVLKPVIKVVPFALNGIAGFVDTALLGSNVLVTAQQGGAIVQSTAPSAATGEFFLARLAPGNYDVVITADGRAAAIVAGVPVANEASLANVSNNIDRISLPVSVTRTISGTITLSPPSSTEAAYAAAKQAVPPLVTVKSQAADLTTGAYSLALPIEPPRVGVYGNGALPIAFAPQTGVAGIYTVEASANGYVSSESLPRNILSADVTQDFVLAQ